jgi:outer membrane receptor for ferrienterochelin and colicin
MKHLRLKVLPLSVLLALPALVAAQTASPSSPAGELSTVVVSATSQAQAIQDVQASVQVISSKDLEGFAGNNVPEALKMATGVDARANGSSSFVAIRGLISNAGSPVLLLVDGLRRTGKYGGPGLNLMGLEEVERVEIVRGPMSALYGADATAGVINIITKAPKPDQAFGGSAQVTVGGIEGGQRDTTNLGVTLNAGTQSTGHRLSVSQRNKGLFRYPGTAVTTYDLSKMDETYLNYEGVLALAPGHELRWLLESVDQDDIGPARTARAPITSFTAYEREKRHTYALRYKGTVGAGVLSADLSKGNAKASTTRSFPTIETTDYDQTELNVRYALDLDAHTVVLGGGVRKDDLAVSIVSTVAKTDNKHLLVQDEWRFAPDWQLLAGLRFDDFSTFGNATTPRASVSYSPGPWNFRLGYGEAYRAPSALEQYARFVRGRFLILGQPTIQPEENKAWELAAAYRGERLQGEWVLFNSNVTNLIQTANAPAVAGDPAGVTTRSIYSNVGKAKLIGSELALAWRVNPNWSVTGGWDYLDAKDDLTGARLVQRARNTYRLGSRYERDGWRLDVQGRYLEDYYASNSVVAPTPAPAPTNTSFGTLDVKLAYQINKTWSAAFGIDNLTDSRQPANYSATGSVQDPPGRFYYLQAKARF